MLLYVISSQLSIVVLEVAFARCSDVRCQLLVRTYMTMQMLLFQCNFMIFDVFHVISDFALQHGASFLNCWHALGESPASGIEGRGRRPAPAGLESK